MNEQKTEESLPEEIPEAVVQSRISQFSIVWIIPLVAVLIGVWLIYKAQSEKGPTITMTFQTAEGLEAGKTKIKYKEVDLGQVQKISLDPDLSQVVVTAKLVKQALGNPEDSAQPRYVLAKNQDFFIALHGLSKARIEGLGDGHLLQESGQAQVQGCVSLPAGLLRQGAGQPGLADPGGTGEQDIEMFLDPLAGGQ